MTAGVLRVIGAGALSLIQDLGRPGFQRFGVSVSGAMDAEALTLGNRLAGNPPGAAAVEVTLGGAEFEFLQDVVFALAGADFASTLDGVPVQNWQSFAGKAGARLKLGPALSGARGYVCLAGGIATAPVLGSRSTHAASRLGGINGRPLAAGDDLPAGRPGPDAAAGLQVPDALVPRYLAELVVHVIPGPQQDSFSARGKEAFYGSRYTVTEKSDRQGVRFGGAPIESRDGRYDIISDAVVAGSVQVPGDGQPIVLMADRQTTGGYAKIAVVRSVDLPALAQAIPGSTVRFVPTTVPDAQVAAKERWAALWGTPLELAPGAHDIPMSVAGAGLRVRIAAGAGVEARGTLALTVDGGPLLFARVEPRSSGPSGSQQRGPML